MRTITFSEYGRYDVLNLAPAHPAPVPAADEVLIKVRASSVNKGDWHYVKGEPFPVRFMAGGLLRPRKNIPGADASGIVTQVGGRVKNFHVGDEVIADLSSSGFGGWAEYTTCKDACLARKPSAVSFAQAATLPVSGVTALQGIRDHGRMQPGFKVLINGATGGVGMYAAMIAKVMGGEVTAVGSSGKDDMLRTIGADHVIHHDRMDFARNGLKYDLILDAAAYRPFQDMKHSLTRSGAYVLAGGSMGAFSRVAMLGAWSSRKGGRTYRHYLAKPDNKDLSYLAGLVAEGKLKPHIDKCFPLEEAPEALRLLEARRVRGKNVIMVDSGPADG